MAGLFDFTSPNQAGLLALSQGLLQAGAPSTKYTSFSQALGQGLGAMQKAQQQSKDDAYEQQLRDYKLGEIKQTLAGREAAKQREALTMKLIETMGDDYNGMLQRGGDPEIIKQYVAFKTIGKPKVARTIETAGDDGGKAITLLDDWGNVIPAGGKPSIAGYVAPQLIQQGDKSTFATPKAGASFPISLSPAQVAEGQRADRKYNQDERHYQGGQSLKREELGLKSTVKEAEKAAAKNEQVASMDVMIDTIDRLAKHPGLPRSTGLYSATPTIPGSDSANFQAELDTFKAQSFVPMVAQLKGMGALSDAEGKKLTDAVGALNPRMSEQAFRSSLERINSRMKEARARATGGVMQAPKMSSTGGWSIQKVD